MANKLADARRSLICAQEAAKKRLEELDNERREVKASLKSLEAALKALDRQNRQRVAGRQVVGVDDDKPNSNAAIDMSQTSSTRHGCVGHDE